MARKKAGDGNRTHVSSLEGWCSTVELHLRTFTYYNRTDAKKQEDLQLYIFWQMRYIRYSVFLKWGQWTTVKDP